MTPAWAEEGAGAGRRAGDTQNSCWGPLLVLGDARGLRLSAPPPGPLLATGDQRTSKLVELSLVPMLTLHENCLGSP